MFNNSRMQLSNTKKAILGAFAYLFEYKVAFIKALIIPFVLLMLITYGMAQDIHAGLVVLLAVLAYLIQAVFAITTHRIILLGRDSVPEWGIYKLTKREIKFVLYMIGLILAMIPFSPFVFIPHVGAIMFVCVILYFVSRLSLVFPAIATDEPISFGDSWENTRHYQLFMLLVLVVFPGIIAIPENILSNFSGLAYVSSVLSVITTVLVIATLSMAYKILCLNNNEVKSDNSAEEV